MCSKTQQISLNNVNLKFTDTQQQVVPFYDYLPLLYNRNLTGLFNPEMLDKIRKIFSTDRQSIFCSCNNVNIGSN